MINRLINRLYWKYVGEVTIFGTINGGAIAVRLKNCKVDKMFIAAGGGVENFHVLPECASEKKFADIIALLKL